MTTGDVLDLMWFMLEQLKRYENGKPLDDGGFEVPEPNSVVEAMVKMVNAMPTHDDIVFEKVYMVLAVFERWQAESWPAETLWASDLDDWLNEHFRVDFKSKLPINCGLVFEDGYIYFEDLSDAEEYCMQKYQCDIRDLFYERGLRVYYDQW